MPNLWITADWHLGEDRFQIMQRPFSTPEEMFAVLLANHNEVVSSEDTVIVNGDVCNQRAPEWLPRVAEFNGRKTLIRGNHDRVFADEQLAPYFERIVPEGEGLVLTSADTGFVLADESGPDINLWVTHYPSRARYDHFNLVGHIHGAWKLQLNSLNVGVDVHHFRPMTLRDVPFYFQAVGQFYDEDVWAAYHAANSAYRLIRGKEGSYLDGLPGRPGV